MSPVCISRKRREKVSVILHAQARRRRETRNALLLTDLEPPISRLLVDDKLFGSCCSIIPVTGEDVASLDLNLSRSLEGVGYVLARLREESNLNSWHRVADVALEIR